MVELEKGPVKTGEVGKEIDNPRTRPSSSEGRSARALLEPAEAGLEKREGSSCTKKSRSRKRRFLRPIPKRSTPSTDSLLSTADRVSELLKKGTLMHRSHEKNPRRERKRRPTSKVPRPARRDGNDSLPAQEGRVKSATRSKKVLPCKAGKKCSGHSAKPSRLLTMARRSRPHQL